MAHQFSYLHEIDHPVCLRCGTQMQLILIEEEYPGYNRRTFGCQSCNGTMMEFAIAPTHAPYSHRL
jgi:hypothetical protein